MFPEKLTTPSDAGLAAGVGMVGDDLDARFTALQGSVDGDIAMAYAPVGAVTARTLGDIGAQLAWSTIKVPLSIAALRADGSAAQRSVTPAITESDNDAAQRLWSMLGTPEQAADAVQSVIREGGDAITEVPWEGADGPYVTGGQTQWELGQQAIFADHLPCMADTGNVVDLMRHIVPDERWGLAAIDGSASKGGWGPDDDGDYLVRQLAILPNGTGQTAITIAAAPHDGSFSSGISEVNTIAEWIRRNITLFPAGNC